MLFATGIRISELVGIHKKDIDFEHKSIKVFGKGAKDRIVIFDEDTKALLTEYTKTMLPETVVIDRSPRTIEKNIRDIAAMAELPKKITPHKLRHSFATQWLQNGGDVVALQKLLGHTSLNTTQIYTHYSVSELSQQYHNVHPLEHKAST
jgi:site-specific recombinase XerD